MLSRRGNGRFRIGNLSRRVDEEGEADEQLEAPGEDDGELARGVFADKGADERAEEDGDDVEQAPVPGRVVQGEEVRVAQEVGVGRCEHLPRRVSWHLGTKGTRRTAVGTSETETVLAMATCAPEDTARRTTMAYEVGSFGSAMSTCP